jgi:hypothetical protein
MSRRAPALAMMVLLSAALYSTSAASESLSEGFISVDETRLEVRQVLALRVASDRPGHPGDVYVYLSDVPLDAAALSAAYVESGYEEERARVEADAAEGGFVKICITPEGGECMLYFHHHSGEQFRRGEIGELSMEHNTLDRVSGRWKLEHSDDMGRTIAFDLRFDAPVLDATKP